MNIEGKTIILTGAKRIGQDVAIALCEKKVSLAIAYNTSREEAEHVREQCRTLGSEAEIYQANLSNARQVRRLITNTISDFGRLDGVIHMAAPYPRTPWEKLTKKDWHEIHANIATSAFLIGKFVGDHLIKNPGEAILDKQGNTVRMIRGNMLFFSDWSINKKPYRDFLPYNSAKGAVESLVRSLAVELGPHGIPVNCIAPGPVLKPPDLTDKENEEVMSRTPLGGWGPPDEVAKAAVFFMETNFVTGVILPVAGGRTIG